MCFSFFPPSLPCSPELLVVWFLDLQVLVSIQIVGSLHLPSGFHPPCVFRLLCLFQLTVRVLESELHLSGRLSPHCLTSYLENLLVVVVTGVVVLRLLVLGCCDLLVGVQREFVSVMLCLLLCFNALCYVLLPVVLCIGSLVTSSTVVLNGGLLIVVVTEVVVLRCLVLG